MGTSIGHEIGHEIQQFFGEFNFHILKLNYKKNAYLFLKFTFV